MPNFTVDLSTYTANNTDGKVRGLDPLGVFSPAGFTWFGATPAFSVGSGTQYYVRADGNDGNAGTTNSAGGAFLTPQKAIDTVTAGDTINLVDSVGTGTTYTVNGANVMNDSGFANLQAGTSGTLAEPITFRTLSGDEGSVTIDSAGTYGNFDLNFQDYWQFYGLRFTNAEQGHINAPDSASHQIDITSKSVGIRIENCYFDTPTIRTPGENTAALRLFGVEDTIVKDVKVVGSVTDVHAIQTYGSSNCLLENSELSAHTGGLFQKSFWYDTDGSSVVDGWEVRHCDITAGIPFFMQTQTIGTPNSGLQYIHHNVLQTTRSVGGGDGLDSCIACPELREGNNQGTRLRIEHNVLYGAGAGTVSTAIHAAAMNDIEVYGNIAANCNSFLSIEGDYNVYQAGVVGQLTESDYNVLQINSGTYFVNLDIFDTTEDNIANLAAWQAETIAGSSTVSLQVDNPDTNSVTDALADLFDTPGTTWTNKTGSAAINLMPGGATDAGPYETGSEVIGLTGSYSAGA